MTDFRYQESFQRRLLHVVLSTTQHVSGASKIAQKESWFGFNDGRSADVGDGVCITRLDHELGSRIIAACEPAGIVSFSRGYGPTYAYIYTEDMWDGPRTWGAGPAKKLGVVIAIARLLHATCDSFGYSATVWFDDDTSPGVIVPGPPVRGPLRDAYVFDQSARSWLTAVDVDRLRSYCDMYRQASSGLPDRVRRAFWQHEYAASVYWVEIRAAAFVAALEALLSSSSRHATQQFVQRGTALAGEFGVSLTESDLKRAWNFRSSIVHGGEDHFVAASDEARIFSQIQALIAGALLRAIEDPEFAAVFGDATEMDRRWPVGDPSRRRSRGGA